MIQIITLFLAITGVFSICYHFTDILIYFSEFWEGVKGLFRKEGNITYNSKLLDNRSAWSERFNIYSNLTAEEVTRNLKVMSKRNKRVYTDKFPSTQIKPVKNQPPPPPPKPPLRDPTTYA